MKISSLTKILSAAMALVMAVSCLPMSAVSSSDTLITTVPDDYIGIYSAQDLDNMREILNGDYILMEDIDLDGILWTPIGTSAKPFAGTFDGNGYSIKNLSVDQPSQSYVGFIGYNNGTVKNLGLVDAKIAGGNYTGGLVGHNAGMIAGSSVSGDSSVSGNQYSGGLIGYNAGTLRRSYATSNVSGSMYVGGLAGGMAGTGLAEQCYATGNVSAASSFVGGFVGYAVGNGANSVIKNCFSTGNVSGSYSGGFLGHAGSSPRIENCYSLSNNPNGFNYSAAALVSCYFNKDLTPLSTANPQSRATLDMVYASTYVGWDFFSVWEIDENKGYPTLIGMDKPPIVLTPDIGLVVNPEGSALDRVSAQITLTVPNEVESVPVEIKLYGEAEWCLYYDSACTQENALHELELSVGENVAYVKIASPSGELIKAYTLTVTRQTPRPRIIAGVRTTSGIYQIQLLWDMAYEASVIKYKIYRSESPDSGYQEITQVNSRSTLTYIDTKVTADVEYYYKISAVDNLGIESFLSVSALGIATVDSNPPVILGITPTSGTMIGKKTGITVRCEDNVGISNISFEYLNDGEWKTLEKRTVSGKAASPAFSLAKLDFDGEVQIRAIATDLAGNVGNGSVTRTYTLKSSGPEPMTGLAATPYENNMLLRWKDVEDETFSYFIVEQKDQPNGAYRRIATVNTTLGYEVKGLMPGAAYWFRVAACDIFDNQGEYAEIETQTLPDATRPSVTSIRPLPGYFANVIPVTVTATDNGAVSEIWFETSADMDNWTQAESVTLNPAKASVSLTSNIIISDIPEGPLFVRAFAKDASGNVSYASSVVEHRADRTPPSKPVGLAATCEVTYIIVQWAKGEEIDLKSYSIYRATDENGPFGLLASNLSSLGYIDRSVAEDRTYWYKVSAFDQAGNESEFSAMISASTAVDDIPPSIHSVSPVDNALVGKNPLIRVLAQDNGRLSAISAEYQYGDEWVSIGCATASGDSYIGNFTWDNSTLPGGTYKFRFCAVDAAGNESDYSAVEYSFQNFELDKPEVTVVPGDFMNTITWTKITANNLLGYKLLRKDGNVDKLLVAMQPQNEAKYVDKNLDPSTAYEYYVEAYDSYGNVSASDVAWAFPLDNDTEPPIANAGADLNAYIGIETGFDGSLSKDNVGIVSYHWDFGDGNVASTAKAVNVYESVGDYKATLTVADAAGNSASKVVNVRVLPPTQGGTIKLRVIDEDTGLPLPFASVYVDFPDDPLILRADSTGVATIIGEPGKYKIAAYITDYLPREQEFEIKLLSTDNATIMLEKGELIVGRIEHRRLTLKEIEDLNIDTEAPENKHVYNFEVTLVFKEVPLPPIEFTINGLGDILSELADLFKDMDLGGLSDLPNDLPMEVYPQVIPHPTNPEIPPTIAFLTISGTMSFLKEFFEVSVIMENRADPQFVLADSTVTLNLPKGLSLAPMLDKQTSEKKLDDIAGGETVVASWIVRGDEEGEYDLTADYSGTLMPFREPVAARFVTTNPLVVNGSRGLSLTLYPHQYLYTEADYLIPFAIKNESDITFNLVQLRFNGSKLSYDEPQRPTLAEDGTDYVLATVAEMDDLPVLYNGDSVTIRELFPGDVLNGLYLTDFDLDDSWDHKLFKLENSFVRTLEGSTIEIPVFIEPIEGPIPDEIMELINARQQFFGSFSLDALMEYLLDLIQSLLGDLDTPVMPEEPEAEDEIPLELSSSKEEVGQGEDFDIRVSLPEPIDCNIFVLDFEFDESIVEYNSFYLPRGVEVIKSMPIRKGFRIIPKWAAPTTQSMAKPQGRSRRSPVASI